MSVRTASDFGLESARDRYALQRERVPRQQPRVLSRFGRATRVPFVASIRSFSVKDPSPSELRLRSRRSRGENSISSARLDCRRCSCNRQISLASACACGGDYWQCEMCVHVRALSLIKQYWLIADTQKVRASICRIESLSWQIFLYRVVCERSFCYDERYKKFCIMYGQKLSIGRNIKKWNNRYSIKIFEIIK